MRHTIADGYRLHAKELRQRAAGVMDNELRRRLYEEAADVDQLADDIEQRERLFFDFSDIDANDLK
jgi:hypothetical protein